MRTYILKLSGENLNAYIRGSVVGIIDVILDIPYKQFPIRQYPNGHCEIRFVATQEQYNAITNALNKRYADVIDYEFIF